MVASFGMAASPLPVEERCRYFVRHLFVAGASDAVTGPSMGGAGLQSQALINYHMPKTGWDVVGSVGRDRDVPRVTVTRRLAPMRDNGCYRPWTVAPASPDDIVS